jgi:ABC-type nitrate/sulfonate/bicarbonate transport system ATPase subunit
MQLELSNVFLAFANKHSHTAVLDGIDLSLNSGEFVSVLGPSGCGKSSLLNGLTGLIQFNDGRVTLNGNDVPHVRQQAAYMQQKDLLLPWRKALPNAMLAAQLLNQDPSDIEREARQLFEAFDLKGFENHYPSQLSGGMRQRVALVRTLLTHRPLMLLDEPFGALDTLTRMRLQDWILKAWTQYEKTVLMVTHDVDEALSLSDKIYVLTARPAQVQTIFEVDLPRPRDRMSMAFAEVRQDFWAKTKGVLSPHA